MYQNMYSQTDISILLRVVGRSRGLPDASHTTLDGFGKKSRKVKQSDKVKKSEHVVNITNTCKSCNMNPYYLLFKKGMNTTQMHSNILCYGN